MTKVLIVDDEKPARDFIADLVTFYIPDSKVTQMDSARKALDCMQSENFDLLFVDILMPGMTGLEMLEELKRMGKKPYTVIISAHRKFNFAVKGMALGAVQYVSKPLDKEKIYDVLCQYQDELKDTVIEWKVPNGIRRTEVNRLLAIERIERGKLKVYVADSFLPEAAGSLSGLEECLPSYFRYIRRDCIINCHAVKQYSLKSREVVVVCQNREIKFSVSRESMRELAALFSSENVVKNSK